MCTGPSWQRSGDADPAAFICERDLGSGCASLVLSVTKTAPVPHMHAALPPHERRPVPPSAGLQARPRANGPQEGAHDAGHGQPHRHSASVFLALRQYVAMHGVAGIRPQVSGPGQPSADFAVQGGADHAMP